MGTNLIESASLSTLLPVGPMFGHSKLETFAPIINQLLLAMTLLVICFHLVIFKLFADLFCGSPSSIQEISLLGSKSCHFLMSVTLK